MKNEHSHISEPRRLPSWMKRKLRETPEVTALKKRIRRLHLHTVCESAGCPNIAECFQKPTATFMIMGDVCTRNCRFCGVPKGTPKQLNPREAGDIAKAVSAMGLTHAVITSVTRDDLADGGASHFSEVVKAVHDTCPETTVETLIPDFNGSDDALTTVLDSGVDILNHNVETVPSLYSRIRPEANFTRSLSVLRRAKELNPAVVTKSGIMVGLGESKHEVMDLFQQLAAVQCDALTIGQYLAPSRNHVSVAEYVHPDQYQEYEDAAVRAGIPWVYAGPYVRSSYNAATLMGVIKEGRNV